MKVTANLATGLVAGFGLLVTGAPAWAAAKNTNSEKVAKILKPAQEALQGKRYAEALAKVKEAQALSEKTPFDAYTIHEFACQANIGTQQLCGGGQGAARRGSMTAPSCPRRTSRR